MDCDQPLNTDCLLSKKVELHCSFDHEVCEMECPRKKEIEVARVNKEIVGLKIEILNIPLRIGVEYSPECVLKKLVHEAKKVFDKKVIKYHHEYNFKDDCKSLYIGLNPTYTVVASVIADYLGKCAYELGYPLDCVVITTEKGMKVKGFFTLPKAE